MFMTVLDIQCSFTLHDNFAVCAKKFRICRSFFAPFRQFFATTDRSFQLRETASPPLSILLDSLLLVHISFRLKYISIYIEKQPESYFSVQKKFESAQV